MKPPKYKMTILIWVALYPSLNIFLVVFGDVLNPLPLPLRTFIISTALVPLLTFVLMPILTKRYNDWLMK